MSYGDCDCRRGIAETALKLDFLARVIHDGSSRNGGVAQRDGRAEVRRPEAYLK
jgi:hypothetical protein